MTKLLKDLRDNIQTWSALISLCVAVMIICFGMTENTATKYSLIVAAIIVIVYYLLALLKHTTIKLYNFLRQKLKKYRSERKENKKVIFDLYCLIQSEKATDAHHLIKSIYRIICRLKKIPKNIETLKNDLQSLLETNDIRFKEILRDRILNEKQIIEFDQLCEIKKKNSEALERMVELVPQYEDLKKHIKLFLDEHQEKWAAIECVAGEFDIWFSIHRFCELAIYQHASASVPCGIHHHAPETFGINEVTIGGSTSYMTTGIDLRIGAFLRLVIKDKLIGYCETILSI